MLLPKLVSYIELKMRPQRIHKLMSSRVVKHKKVKALQCSTTTIPKLGNLSTSLHMRGNQVALAAQVKLYHRNSMKQGQQIRVVPNSSAG